MFATPIFASNPAAIALDTQSSLRYRILRPTCRAHRARAGLLLALLLVLSGCQRGGESNSVADNPSVARVSADSPAQAVAGQTESSSYAGGGQLATAQASRATSLTEKQFLPVDEAFKLDLVPGDQGMELVWTIAPDYYLYKHKFKILARYAEAGAQQDLTTSASFSPGLHKTDDYYGRVEVYYHQAVSQLTSTNERRGKPVALIVEYQGCADAGLCYPVQTRTLAIDPMR